MKHLFLSAGLFALSLTALCSCSQPAAARPAPAAASSAAAKGALIQRITNLPDYCVYEESKESFIERLHHGDYWAETEGGDTVEYLHTGGDGCWGCRLFMLVNRSSLYILIEDWEGEPAPTEDYILRHHAQSNNLSDFGSVPKSILAADSPDAGRPARAWFRLMEHRGIQF